MKFFDFFISIIISAFIFTLTSGCSNPGDKKNNSEVIDTIAVARAHNDTGLQYVRNEKDYNKGIIYFSKAIQVKPNYSVAYSNRGNAYRFLKQFEKAEADLKMAIKLAPSDSIIHKTIARLYMDSEQYEKAVNEFSIVLQMKGLDSLTLGNVYAERGKAYKNLKDSKLAQKDISKAISYGYKIEDEN